MANMTFKANLLPDNASGQKELGSSTKKWKIYAEEIDVTGDAHLHNETYADSITVGDLVVTGSTNLKTSDIVNDSGFITVNDIPEGAAASTTTPKMDGTAAAGTELAFARGDHVHPSDTTKVDKVTGKGLSTNDYTNSEKTKLSGIATGAQVNVLEGIQKNGTAVTITNKVANITVPTKTSDITNDSGFITAADVPAGIQPTTTTPKMDGTAAIGTETQYAKGDHVHPSDTTKVDKISGKGLSTNDFTTALKNKLEGISAGAEVNVQSDWNQTTTSADDYIKNKPSIPTKVSDLTNDSGYITSADVPEGASASVTDPLMDGTAATGTSTAFARGDHVHPTDTSRAASDHTHGNITNDGDITATAPTIANGDQLIINDHSKSKITNGPTFDGTTTTKALTPKGTWETFNNYSLPLAADGTRGGIQIGYTQSGQNYPIQLSSEKAYVNVPWTDTKVTQAYSTTNSSYPLLLSATNGVTSTGSRGATTSILNNSFYANPNTGTLSTKNLVITDTSATARIEFSRVGTTISNAPNYIQFPASSRLNFVGGATRGNDVSMMILESDPTNPSIFPGKKDTVNLGTSSLSWNNIYTKTVTLSQDPVNALEAATKQYVDNKVGNEAFEIPVLTSSGGWYIPSTIKGTDILNHIDNCYLMIDGYGRTEINNYLIDSSSPPGPNIQLFAKAYDDVFYFGTEYKMFKVTAAGNSTNTPTVDAIDFTQTMDGDRRVYQSYSTTNASYPLLLTSISGITNTSSRGAYGAILNNNIYANPSTGTVTATTFSGALSGNATTATTATNLSAAPSLAASGNNITVTAGGKTSSAFTVPYATSAGTATKLGTANKGSSMQPIYLSSGTPKACTIPSNGAWWSAIPQILQDGVMEVGKYIDFHTTSNGTTDYDVRITAETTGLTISGTTVGTFSGNLNGTASIATKLGTANKGSGTKPIYLAAGVPTECSTYAGGTAVTLNGASKAASTASFYAPTSAGTSGYILKSNGSGAPTWLQTLPIANGGTGFTSYTKGNILYANNASQLSKLPIGTEGQVLGVSNNGLPQWQEGGIVYIDDFEILINASLHISQINYIGAGTIGDLAFKIRDYLNQGRTPIIRYRTPELQPGYNGGLHFGNLYFYYINTEAYYDSGDNGEYSYNFMSSVYFNNYLHYYIIKVNWLNETYNVEYYEKHI